MTFAKHNSARHRVETSSHAVRNTTIAAAAAGAAVAGAVAPAQAYSGLVDLGGNTSYGTPSTYSLDSYTTYTYQAPAAASYTYQAPAETAYTWQAPAAPSYETPAAASQAETASVSTQSTANAGGIVGTAYQGLGGAYVWGGTSFKAWDCSGFTQWVYAQNGINLPRVTWAQFAAGTPTANPQPGDLVSQNGGSHVGIYIGNGQMISALNPAQGTQVHSVNAMQVDGYYTFR